MHSDIEPFADQETDARVASLDRRDRPDWRRLVAIVAMHAGCLGVIWVGWSPTAVVLALVFYVARAFGLTAFYHRYYSHRAFKTSRWFQFLGAALGCLAMQKGPLWWAAHHREHHRRSDHEGDVHSPHVHGVLWAHMGWFLTPANNELRSGLIRDWLRFPELRWLDRRALWAAPIFAISLYAFGELLKQHWPGLKTDGPMLVVWVFFISTVALYHATYCVNSLAHLFGSRRYATRDDSRNNALVAFLTLGEGWHNNHHHYPTAARQGFFWWEVDVTYYVLWGLERLGLVWSLKPVPRKVLMRQREAT
ncbi:acyl-CoA desaturase [Singulisphaera sp. PoT]|uniref:acyl-CoA desaturase n=1 Tax=Singulisphaera sp. PoT TaxID=3411797 RepID=UPI003BF61834